MNAILIVSFDVSPAVEEQPDNVYAAFLYCFLERRDVRAAMTFDVGPAA